MRGLAERLKAMRTLSGLAQHGVAARVRELTGTGPGVASWRRAEINETEMSLWNACAVAAAFGVSMDFLCFGIVRNETESRIDEMVQALSIEDEKRPLAGTAEQVPA